MGICLGFSIFNVSGLRRLGTAAAACLGRVAHAAGIGASRANAAVLFLPAIGSSYHADKTKAAPFQVRRRSKSFWHTDANQPAQGPSRSPYGTVSRHAPKCHTMDAGSDPARDGT